MDDDQGSLQWMAEMLAEYADLLNAHGSQSPEAREFAMQHGWHDELADQIDAARRLKSAAELSGNR